MTIEQFNEAGKIMHELRVLNIYKRALDCDSAKISILIKYFTNPVDGVDYEHEQNIKLEEFPDLLPDLIKLISGYFSDKIAELEKQLEEL